MSVEAIIEGARDLQSILARPRADARSLVDAMAVVGRLHRLIEGVGIDLAGQVVQRSAPGTDKPLAKALGERSPQLVLQAFAGLDPMDAMAWCRVGVAIQPRVTLLGEALPPSHPALTAAIDEGTLRIGCAARVLDVLEQIEPYSSVEERAKAEAFLVAEAPLLSDRGFARACGELAARFVPDRIEQREALARRRAGVEFRQTRDGRSQLVVDLHPEAEGFIRSALDARTAPRRQPSFADAEVELDLRPLRQKRLDALVSIMRASLGSDVGRVAGTSVTMHVTVELAALRSGLGSAKIVGVDQPIPASVARRLAADARIIPCVLGGAGEPLDLGRSVRLATESQRVALAIRDGGCIWPMCEAPPGWCEVAHVRAWADGGSTDLDNLMLLCPFHHRYFDNDGLAAHHSRRRAVPRAAGVG